MSTSYAVRLLGLCMASFFLLHIAIGVAVALAGPALVRRAERMRARRAARLLLAARLFPAGMASFLVVGVCIPSFVWREPELEAEQVGFVFLAASALGLAVVLTSIARSLSAALRSAHYSWQAAEWGTTSRAAGCRSKIWIVDASQPFLSLTGILNPRIVVSRAVVEALSPEQLAAALRHERAHRLSYDNLKRLLILMAPGLLPFCHGFRQLERGWSRFTEWAADDYAVAGNSRRSLSLAAALVRVARMGAGPGTQPLVTSLLSHAEDLPARVYRLLKAAPARERRRGMPVLGTVAWVAVTGVVLGLMFRPATMDAVHEVLEELVH